MATMKRRGLYSVQNRASYLRHRSKRLAERRRRYRQNRKKFLIANKAYRLKNRDRIREYMRGYKLRNLPFKLTRKKPNRCECCKGPPTTQHKTFAMDHDHKTGKFRGWLCHRCNTAIGLLGDNIRGIKRALSYLQKAKS
jgi:hypothetical protein